MKSALLILALFATTVLFAQNEGDIWYFGDHAGLDFNSGSPVTLNNGQIYLVPFTGFYPHNEGTSAISNSNGELLFYSNGAKLWNQDHSVTPNGDSLLGHPSSTQSSLFVPKPGNPRYIYLFTQDGFWQSGLVNGLRYSIIDRCLDSRKGDIIPGTKNTMLLDYPVAEKLTAVRHANGVDYWVLTHKMFTDEFYAYLLTQNGISDTVVSNAGSVHDDPSTPFDIGVSMGQMKVSPDGSNLAVASCNRYPPICELFDFNNATGVVSNGISLVSGPLSSSILYGVAFSPDNSKLYISANISGIFQFDLSAGGSSIPSTMTEIANTNSNLAGMQLGPDGKIYVAKENEFYVGTINNPNAAGPSCGFVSNGVYLNGNKASWGLPGFVANYDYSNIPPAKTEPPLLNDTTICKGDSIRLDIAVEGNRTYSWTPSSLVDDSTLAKPLAFPESTTTFSVVSHQLGSCLPDTSEVTVSVLPAPEPGIIGDTFDICLGDTLQILSTGGNTYEWFPKTNILLDQTPVPQVFPEDTTLYELIIGYGLGCTWKDTAWVNVDDGGGELPSDTAICSGQAVTLGASGYQEYEWKSSGTLPCINCSEITVGPATSTEYTLSANTGQECEIAKSITVQVNDLPEPVITGPDTLCLGQTGYLEVEGAPNSTYQWQPDLANPAKGAVQPSKTTTYYLTATDTTTNCATTDSHKVVLADNYQLNTSKDTMICYGGSVQLAASGGNAIEWSPGDDLSCTQCHDPIAQPLVTTTYTVTTGTASACNDTAYVTVEVATPPSDPIKVNSLDLCAGDTLELQATGGNSYNWNPKENIIDANTATPEVFPEDTTTYTLTITYGQYDCPWEQEVTVNVIEGEGTLPTDTTICPGDSTTLTAEGYQSYEWESGGALPCTNCSEIKVGPTNTTDYTLTATVQGGCEIEKTVTVTVDDGPAITINGPDSLCAGMKDTLTAHPEGVQYKWFPENSIVQATGEIQPESTITYTVKATEACNAEATHQVVVKDLPPVTAETDTLICLGESAPLQASGAENYQWSPASAISCTNCPDPIATPTQETAYTVTGTGANGCKNTDSVTVDVSPNPIVTVPNDTTICKGDEIRLRALDPNDHEWEPASEVDCPTCDTVTVAPNTRTVFTVTAFGPESCTATDSIVVDVQKPEVTASGDTTVCPDLNFTLTASGAQSYEWQPTGETGPTIETSTGQSQTMTVTGFDNLGCTDTAHVQVTIHDTINPAITGDTIICPGEAVTWTVTEGQTAYWSELDTTAMTITLSTLQPLNLSTHITDQNGCTYERTKQLTLHPTPTLSATPDQTIRQYETLRLEATGAATYTWQPSTHLDDSTISRPTFTAMQEGEFTYTITGYNQYGCRDTATTSITVEPEPQVTVPNAFSPNGDGNNDVFEIKLPEDHELRQLHVYDRWGNLIFASQGQPWDGTINDEPAQVGVYVYVVRYEDDRGEVKERQGNVTLLR